MEHASQLRFSADGCCDHRHESMRVTIGHYCPEADAIDRSAHEE